MEVDGPASNDEWVVVTRKSTHQKRRKSKGNHRSNTEPKITAPDEKHAANIIKRISSYVSMNCRSAIACDIYAMYHDQLAGHHPIRRTVIAGLGNMDQATNRDVTRARTQFALFHEICRGLTSNLKDLKVQDNSAKKHEVADPLAVLVPTMAQDPAFTETDRLALETMHVQVLHAPEATDTIDENTFVFVPFVDAIVLLPEILAGKKMALYVGTDIQEIYDTMSNKSYSRRLVFYVKHSLFYY
jgi:hypothetical protein